MEESYAELVRKSDNYKTEKNTKFKEISKDRLLKISKKKSTNYHDWCFKHYRKTSWFFVGL